MESMSTYCKLDLLIVAFISRYCAMEMIEVDAFYPDVHSSHEFTTLNLFDFLCVYLPHFCC